MFSPAPNIGLAEDNAACRKIRMKLPPRFDGAVKQHIEKSIYIQSGTQAVARAAWPALRSASDGKDLSRFRSYRDVRRNEYLQTGNGDARPIFGQ